MRIAIDMQGVQTGSKYRGIGRYASNFVKALRKESKESNEFLLFFNGLFDDGLDEIIDEYAHIFGRSSIKVWYSPGPVSSIDRRNMTKKKVAEAIQAYALERTDPDVILFTTVMEGYGDDCVIAHPKKSSLTVPTVGIFYDLIPLLNETAYLSDPDVNSWYRNQLDVLKELDLLLAISGSSAREAVEHLGRMPKDVVTISTAVNSPVFHDQIDSNESRSLRDLFGLERSIVSYASASDPRKNHRRLIKAYSILSQSLRSKHQLVFIGGMPKEDVEAFRKYAREVGLTEDELVLTGRVTDEQIAGLYRMSTGMVFPSWHEGFGLPVLEAIHCGCPVIGANASSIPEVVGVRKALFNPYSVGSISAKLSHFLSDENFRSELKYHQALHAQNFSWQRTARRALDALDKLIDKFKNRSDVEPSAIESPVNHYYPLVSHISELEKNQDFPDLCMLADSISQTEHGSVFNTLFIDVSELAKHDAGTGIQRVTRRILTELLSSTNSNFNVVPVYAEPGEGYKLMDSVLDTVNQLTLTPTANCVSYRRGDIFLGLDLIHPSVALGNAKFYDAMRNYGVSVYFVIYDLIPIDYPQFTNIGVAEGHNDWLSVVLNNDGVFCISRSVMDRVQEYINSSGVRVSPSFRLDYFPLGADFIEQEFRSWSQVHGDIVVPRSDTSLSFLMVGTIEPRKGHVQVLDAFEQLWEQGFTASLSIVGRQGWMVEGFVERLRNHPEWNKRLFWLDGISDDHLERVYAASTCLIYASYAEGFGLPLIEAAQHKLPIIARDIPVFREVAGEHAYYFKSEDPAGLVQAIKTWLSLYQADKHPKPDQMAWRTWKESSDFLLEALSNKLNVK